MLPPLPLRLLLLACLLALGGNACAQQLNAQEQQLAALFTNASGQQRPDVQLDPILCRVARARAADLARRNYFAHVNPDGHGANFLVRQAGYTLPPNYNSAPSGNNIESLAAGDPSASGAWGTWMGSSSHKQHLLGQSAFFAEQTALGVGYAYDPNSDYRHYWVILTAPPPGPALTITSPAANAGLTTPAATIAGTTGGNPAATRVIFRLENANGIGAFQNASGSSAWSATVTDLPPGPNTIRVRSLDASGTQLMEATRTFRYVVLKPLSVAIAGTGSITAGFLGTTQRELGARYTIKATAPAGFLFDRWTGSLESTAPTLTFTMEEGLTLTANFRVNPFYALKGTYAGLVATAEPDHATSGLLRLTLLPTGGYSGRLFFGGKSYALAGKFNSFGAAAVTLRRGPLPPLQVSLQFDMTGQSQQLAATIFDGTSTAVLAADAISPATTRFAGAGRYTIALPPHPNDAGPEFPRGSGWATMTVSAAGAVSLSGALADGRPFTATANVLPSGAVPLYVPLLGGSGSLLGTLAIDPQGAVTGSLRWTKPERPLDRVLPAAFETVLLADGARYVAPLAGQPALDVALGPDNSAIALSGGDLADSVQQLATLLPTNVVSIPAPQLPRLAVTLSGPTGRFTGTFTHPVTKAVSRISGVILRGDNRASGFFLGQTGSGSASLVPMR